MPGANARGTTNLSPPGEDGSKDLYVRAAEAAVAGARAADGKAPEEPLSTKLLRLVATAEASAERYTNFARKSWDRAYRAFRNQHFEDSKYNSKEYRARSKIFRPKTRSAIRKMMASTAASLFSTVDALAIQAGNEADPASRAGAALMQELVNYRTDRTSGRNAIPWFKCAMGAVQDAWLTGIVVSKQYWKLQTKQVGEQPVHQTDPETGEPVLDESDQPIPQTEIDAATGAETPVMQPVLKAIFDRPDLMVIPPENIIIDSGADWTDPVQSAAFLIIKWPMKLDDVREREKDPRDPWKHLTDSQLRGSDGDRTTANSQGIRNAREGGVDRFDRTNNTDEFSIVWVYEVYVRTGGEDYTFFSVRSQHLLTDPKPVEIAYPWNDGERPVCLGYGSLEAHKIFPMSPAEGLQQMQTEINDLANLTLDTVKMNVSPVAKVRRGRQVDLEQLRNRAPGTNLLMTSLDDVTFEKPPGPDSSAFQQMERLNVDFDDLAGQFNAGSVQTNRQLNETVGGMRLISGAANALQEFDQRVFIETWAEPALAQVVRLCQYYEHDETVLGLCGERAKLWEKHGIDQITDHLLDAQITTRIDIGVGAGDPQQRLAKFQMATAATLPLLQNHRRFQNGEYELDIEAVMQEAYGSAGYRDGGKRFIKKNETPQQQGPSPQDMLAIRKLLEEINNTRAQGDLNRAKAYAAIKKVGLDELGLIADLLSDERAAHQPQQGEPSQQQQPQAQPAQAGSPPGGAAPSIDPQKLAALLHMLAAQRGAQPVPAR